MMANYVVNPVFLALLVQKYCGLVIYRLITIEYSTNLETIALKALLLAC